MKARLKLKSERRVGLHAISEVNTKYPLEFRARSADVDEKGTELLREMAALMEEEMGNDNYLGEMAAQLDALDFVEAGCRVVIVFDATSPVEAMRHFRYMCDRARSLTLL